jgi:hypothetical protein
MTTTEYIVLGVSKDSVSLMDFNMIQGPIALTIVTRHPHRLCMYTHLFSLFALTNNKFGVELVLLERLSR